MSNPGAALPAALLVFLQPVPPRGSERAAVVGVAAVLVLAGVGRLVEGRVVVEAAGPARVLHWHYVKLKESKVQFWAANCGEDFVKCFLKSSPCELGQQGGCSMDTMDQQLVELSENKTFYIT